MSDFSSSSSALLEPPVEKAVARQEAARVNPQLGRVPGLDGLRAIAILFVILSKAVHSPGFPISDPYEIAGLLGGMGVDLFFVISGFLITSLLIREQDRTGTVSLRDFYIRRSLRIMPAYFTYLAALACLQIFQVESFTPLGWAAALTWTTNIFDCESWDLGHLWSLSVEEHFYLIWPLLFCLLPTRTAMRTIWASFVVVFITRWVVLLDFPQYTELARFWTWTRYDPIAAGCLLAYFAQDKAWSATLDRLSRRTWFWPMVLLGLTATVGLMLVSTKSRIGFAFTTGTLATSLLVWGVVRQPHRWMEKILNHPVIVQVGVLSYSLYLWHRLVLRPSHLAWNWTWIPVNLLELTVLAVGCHYLVERPFLKLKDRWSRRSHRER